MPEYRYNNICSLRRTDIAGLCKGSTADSDSVCEGSNPSPAAIESPETVRFQDFSFAFDPLSDLVFFLG